MEKLIKRSVSSSPHIIWWIKVAYMFACMETSKSELYMTTPIYYYNNYIYIFILYMCIMAIADTQSISTRLPSIFIILAYIYARVPCLEAKPKHDHFYWIFILYVADRQKHQTTNQLQHKLPNRFGLYGSIILLLTFHMFGIKWINIKFNSLQMTAYYIIAFKRTTIIVPNRACNYLIDFSAFGRILAI